MRTRFRAGNPIPAAGALALACLACGVSSAQTTGASPSAVTGDARVDRLLGQMTLAEKISLIHGATESAATNQGQAGYWPGLPRLGIPALRLADGPPGVLTRVPSTGLTATMGLAATWSRQDAEQNGAVIGRDARALGIDVVLEPYINLYRDPTFGRAYNTYGEDPVLTGQIGAAVIRGVQRQGVMAQAKHYIAYEGGNDVIVDPQTLHEVYVAPFADAIAAGVSSVMGSYNKVNGVYASGNPDTLTTILRDEMGFKGFVTSDWGATHSTLYVNAGLDLEMPGSTPPGGFGIPSYFSAEPPAPAPARPAGPPPDFLMPGGIPEEPQTGRGGFPGFEQNPTQGMLAAVQAGQVSEATITRAAGRILYMVDRFGFLDHAPKHDVTPVPSDKDAPVIRKTAADAAVLLKNDGGALPLKVADLASLALIGPGALQTIAIGEPGEKALGIPSRRIGPADALRRANPAATLTVAVADDMTGVPVPASALSHDGQPGLLRTDSKTNATRTDAMLRFATSSGNPLPAGSSYTWTGTLTIPTTGAYNLYLQLLGTGGSFSIDGKRIAGTGSMQGNMHGDTLQANEHNVLPTTDGLDNIRRRVDLTAGPHALTVTTQADTSGNPVQVRLAWVTPEQQQADRDAALAAARKAHTAVVFAWGRNRPVFGLPGDQDALIADVAAANPNTVVVLNTSEPVAMPWLDKVRAVLQMWYPGDEGGPATADVLLGKVSPAGRLPFTWPKTLDQGPANDPAHPERSSAGVDGKTTYAEGVNIGYRWYDQQNLQPLFPFGYGLSYTTYAYSDLKVTPARDGGLDVSFRLRNAGPVDGDEVPQVYLSAPRPAPADAQFAVRALAAFDRLHLKRGETRTVTLHVPPRALQYWSTPDRRWKTAAGTRTVSVGTSSRDLRLHGDATVGQ